MKKKILGFSLLLCALSMAGCTVKDKTITVNYNGDEIKGIYSGDIKSNKPNGNGKFNSLGGEKTLIFDGSWKEGQVDNGELEADYSISFYNTHIDGIYRGMVINGKPEGDGKLIIQDGSFSYDGSWNQGALSNGKIICDYSIDYEGKEIKGQYTGQISNGGINGEGEFNAADAGFNYTGNWGDGLPHGEGELNYSQYLLEYDGIMYTGNYIGSTVNAKPDGTGDFESAEKGKEFKYNGNWKDGKVSGSGHIISDPFTVHFKELDREGAFDGAVLDGIPTGEGIFTAINGDGAKYTYTGEWKNGRWNGKGVQEFEKNDDGYNYTYSGTFVDGNFVPDELDFIQSVGTNSGEGQVQYVISDKAYEFIETHMDFFPVEDREELKDLVDSSISFEKIAKKPADYGNNMMSISKASVIQIEEIDNWWGEPRTVMLIETNSYNNIYYVLYNGVLPDVYSNSSVECIALPVAYSQYDNTGGGITKCVVLYASYIKKK